MAIRHDPIIGRISVEITKNQVIHSAVDLLKKAFPDLVSDFYLIDTVKFIIDPLFHVRFGTMINGIPAPNQPVSVDVDSQTGNAVSLFTSLRMYRTLSKPDTAISESKAKSLFISHMPLTLEYWIPYNEKLDNENLWETRPEAIPVYAIPQTHWTSQVLNAQTRQWEN